MQIHFLYYLKLVFENVSFFASMHITKGPEEACWEGGGGGGGGGEDWRGGMFENLQKLTTVIT